jgi:molybdate transport system regulatory protein
MKKQGREIYHAPRKARKRARTHYGMARSKKRDVQRFISTRALVLRAGTSSLATRSKQADLQPVFRLSLEDRKQIVLDQKDAILLRRISETNSLTEGAKLAAMSYRNAWDRIKRVEKSLGIKIVETTVGGATGGGARLTPEGTRLLQSFRTIRKYLFNALEDRESMDHIRYKLSARNKLKAKVTKIEKGPITASIKMTVILPASLTSIISKEAVEDLELKVGDEVEAVVKSTEVMIGKET